MKFIHTADLHLGNSISELRYLGDSKKVIIQEFVLKSLSNLVELALKEKVDFMVIAGDLFDSSWKDYSIGLYFIEQISKLSCPIFYIYGNHDAESLFIKKLSFPANLYTFSSDAPETKLHPSMRVALHGQSYPSPANPSDMTMRYPKALPGYYNIGLLHTSGEGAEGTSNYSPFSMNNIRGKDYNYWALGHVHKNKVISENPYTVYPGCTQGRHINEPGRKGCYLVEFDLSGNTNAEFKELSELEFGSLKLKFSGDLNQTLNQFSSLIESDLKNVSLIKNITVELQTTSLEGHLYSSDYWLNQLQAHLHQNQCSNIYINKVLVVEKAAVKPVQINRESEDLIKQLRSLAFKCSNADLLKGEIDSLLESLPTDLSNTLKNELKSEMESKDLLESALLNINELVGRG